MVDQISPNSTIETADTHKRQRISIKNPTLALGVVLLAIGLLNVGLVFSNYIVFGHRDTLDQREVIALIIFGFLTAVGIVISYIGVAKIDATKAVRLVPSTQDIDLAVEQLARNYEAVRAQTTYAFILSAIFMMLGLLVILLGSVRVALGQEGEPSYLVTVSGVITEFISGSALLLYRSNFKRLDVISSRLDNTWRILAAYKLARDLPKSEQKEAILPLLSALAGPTENIS